VSSGVVELTVGPALVPAGWQLTAVEFVGGVSGSDLVQGPSGNVRCGAMSTLDTCDFVLVRFRVTSAAGIQGQLPNNLPVSVTGRYIPDNPLRNTPANLPATTVINFVAAAQVIGGLQPAALRIRCTSVPTATTAIDPVTPGQIGGGLTPLAVGVLPAVIPCVVEPVNAAGNVIVAAPGTIEVSALSGSLLSLAGTLSTNLRIPCGTGPLVNIDQGVVNPNTCQGVRFSVVGQGVGVVEILARYEPTPVGLREVEARGSVAFVAPQVVVTLTLNPNPVGVGATGTATASLSRAVSVVCSTTTTVVTAPDATATATTVIPCIDPTTGLPISSSAGSWLNGAVAFTIENTAIARFNEAAAAGATTGTTINTGVFTSAGQVIKSCGAFSAGISTAVPLLQAGQVASLAPFFGGCLTVATTYVGVEVGSTAIAATFIPFLPGAANFQSALFGTSGVAFGAGLTGLNFFAPGIGPANSFQILQVAGAAAATTQTLVPGCNNVVAPATENITQLTARVDPQSAAASFWKQVPGTVQFQGAPAAGGTAVPAGVANLTGVTALDAIFVCVTARATWKLN
jgi:hypothetical protein